MPLNGTDFTTKSTIIFFSCLKFKEENRERKYLFDVQINDLLVYLFDQYTVEFDFQVERFSSYSIIDLSKKIEEEI